MIFIHAEKSCHEIPFFTADNFQNNHYYINGVYLSSPISELS